MTTICDIFSIICKISMKSVIRFVILLFSIIDLTDGRKRRPRNLPIYPCTSMGIQWIRHPENCSKYYICGYGKPHLLPPCPPAYVWSTKYTNCVPTKSRWDDCDLYTKKKTTSGNVRRRNPHFITRRPKTTSVRSRETTSLTTSKRTIPSSTTTVATTSTWKTTTTSKRTPRPTTSTTTTLPTTQRITATTTTPTPYTTTTLPSPTTPRAIFQTEDPRYARWTSSFWKRRSRYPSSGITKILEQTSLTMTSTPSPTTEFWPTPQPSTPKRPIIIESSMRTSDELKSSIRPPMKYHPECGVAVSRMIVGGTPSHGGRWPWVASLRLTWANRHVCGGTLVHPQWVVTAAHCVFGSQFEKASDWRAILGETHAGNAGAQMQREVDLIVRHPEFVNGGNYPNDIAMMRLDKAVDVAGLYIRHACLPERDANFQPEDSCWIMGWGETKGTSVYSREFHAQGVLQELKVTVRKNNACAARWGWKRILNSHICVGNGDIGACNGDSGGPLVCSRRGYYYLVGVTSWGVSGCQTSGYPSVFTRTSFYHDWMEDIIQTYSKR